MAKKKINVAEQIRYWKAKNLSDRSLAAKCGLTLEEFKYGLNTFPELRVVYEEAAAEFEASQIEAIDNIMADPETPLGTKYKNHRENLKTIETWAPATRAVQVQVEDSRTVLDFDALTEQETADIVAAHKDDEAEDQSKED